MRKGTLVIGLAAAACLLSAAGARAASPKYTFAEGGFSDVDVETAGLDSADGWFATISGGGERVHVFAERREESGETTTGILETEQSRAGIGFHGLLGERGDLVLEGGLIDYERRVALGNAALDGRASDTGYFAGGGLRYRILPSFEIGAFAGRRDYGSAGDDMRYEARVTGYLGRLGVGVGYATFEDAEDEQLDGFVRYEFGKD